MKKYGVRGVVPILAAVLVLGLAASGFSQGKWVFGVKGNIAWVQPIKEGGYFAEDFNELVTWENLWLEDLKQEITDADPGNEITIDLAEKINRAYSMHAYAERRIGDRFALRISGEYLWTNKSKSGWDAYYWDWWEFDWVSEVSKYEISASAWKLAIAPRLIIPVGGMVVNLGAGPFYISTKTAWTSQYELTGDWSGNIFQSTSNGELSGNGWGYYADLELKFKLSDRMAIDVEVGYESTPKLTTSGPYTTAGEVWGVPFDDEYELEGASDWTGFYVAVSLEFTI